MGKTRGIFKKSRDIKGTLHAKMGKIKDRNGMDLTEAEDIKKEEARTHRRTVQETGIKTIPKKKKCKKAKWLSEEVLNRCEKKRSEKQRRKGKI